MQSKALYRWAALLFVVAVVFFFLAALQVSGAAPSWPKWFEDAGLAATAAGLLLWVLPSAVP